MYVQVTIPPIAYFARRLRSPILHGFYRRAAIALLVIVFTFAVPVFAQTAGAPKLATRDCKLGYDDSIGKKKSSPPKRKGAALAAATAPSCIEVHQSAISAQEYLQLLVRDLRWNIGDEQASEELWSFTIYLEADGVAAYTKPPVDPKVEWSGGKGVVTVRTTELPDGFTRIVVNAKFDGYGDAEDKFALKRSSWPLPSSGSLETRLTAAARDRFSPAQ